MSFEPKLSQLLPTFGPQTDQVLRVMGSKVRVAEIFPSKAY